MSAAYTIGNEISYDRDLAENGCCTKLGKHAGYIGGWVWETPEEAAGYKHGMVCKVGVYELELPLRFESMVEWNDEDRAHHLLLDAKIVKRVLI